MFAQGVAAAWFNVYIQSQPEYMEYVTTEENVPVSLSMFDTDVSC